ncbi:GerMN domain-containing protein [Clostridium senegalense]|uniref:GerMN domain-containing protein n=1 Tax=Clostridium senegalense TaxID=1465809 RepID=A0A6M0H0L9_9CLOT|nr:GerMN domain-containing protein [Clostridium senegalense]NEU04336.1 GerMN domain-containing protein [Clostridium senegalense]
MKKKSIIIILIIAFTIIGVLSFINYDKKDKNSALNKEKIKNLNVKQEESGEYLDLTLYFDGTENDSESKILKEERLVDKEELLGEIIVQELLKGPSVVSQSKAIFPKDTRLLSFSIKDGIAYVNLSEAAKVEMNENKEKTTLTCLATSLTQLSSIDKVMLTIDNKNLQTIGGNYDVSKPFSQEDINGLKLK